MKALKKIIIAFVALHSLFLFTPRSLCYASDFGPEDSWIKKGLRKIMPSEKLTLAGYLKNETSIRTAHGFDEFMKFRNIAQLEAEYDFADWLDFFVILHWFYDGVYDIEDRYESVSFEDVNKKLRYPEKTQWLRECYFDILTDRLDVRLGKQQVVWGTADGVRILDMVNPLDYREWTLPSYVNSRIPLWMLNAEGELLMDGHLQLLLIPDYEPNYYAPAGAPFTLRTVQVGAEKTNALEEAGITVQSIDERPARRLDNTKIGLRWQNIIGGFDYTLNYLHTYDFASSAYTVMDFQKRRPVRFTLTRRSEQIDVFGGSFSKTLTSGLGILKGWTLRGEFAYIHNGAMNYGINENIAGTVDVNQYNYVLGFDKNFLRNWLFSFQIIQFITDNKESFPEFYNGTAAQNTLLFGPTRGPLDDVETMLTLKISTDFIHERLKPEVLVLYGDDNDWRISPKVFFEINDYWSVTTGMHIFEGTSQHLNGQFDDNDQVFVETMYSW